jgi:hypothetical protein
MPSTTGVCEAGAVVADLGEDTGAPVTSPSPVKLVMTLCRWSRRDGQHGAGVSAGQVSRVAAGEGGQEPRLLLA